MATRIQPEICEEMHGCPVTQYSPGRGERLRLQIGDDITLSAEGAEAVGGVLLAWALDEKDKENAIKEL